MGIVVCAFFSDCVNGQDAAPQMVHGYMHAHSCAHMHQCMQVHMVAILIQRTNESMIIEEYTGSKASDFDTAHERKLDY